MTILSFKENVLTTLKVVHAEVCIYQPQQPWTYKHNPCLCTYFNPVSPHPKNSAELLAFVYLYPNFNSSFFSVFLFDLPRSHHATLAHFWTNLLVTVQGIAPFLCSAFNVKSFSTFLSSAISLSIGWHTVKNPGPYPNRNNIACLWLFSPQDIFVLYIVGCRGVVQLGGLVQG